MIKMNSMERILIPYWFKWLGITLVVAGLIFTFLYDRGVSIDAPVLAVISSFLRTRYFIVFNANITDELALASYLTGLILLSISKEKTESPHLSEFRSKALLSGIILNSIFILFSIVFLFGSSFIIALILNVFSFFIFYLISFYFFKIKSKT